MPELDELRAYMEKEGINDLYPLQKDSIDILSKGESLLLTTPTSSGKTLVAYYGMLRAWKRGLRSLYVVPLRALAEEKNNDLKFFASLGMKATISTGDYDRPSNYLKNYDVIISTSEKVDSLLRNNQSVFENVGFVVFDEIHNIVDETRGTTLEIVISKIRQIIEGVQFIAMSATVRNSNEVSEWLGSKLISSNFRPVPLRRFVATTDFILDDDGRQTEEVDSFEDFVAGTLQNSGQTLVFLKSRRSTESTAERLSEIVSNQLKKSDIDALKDVEISKESVGSEKLINLLHKGIGFHHAGMLSEQRRLVEKLFREKKIKVITATTTLAAGLNLPARSVVIKDIYRYDGFSSVLIPNLEVQQMMGRAGRVQFDKTGYGYIWSTKHKLNEVFSTYIYGELESITSRMNESKVRMHVLGLISSGMCRNTEALLDFFNTTLANYEGVGMNEWVEKSVEFLKKAEMIKGEETYRATPFGRRVSELYIDPITGSILRETSKLTDVDDLIMGICATPDMPSLYVSSTDNFVGYPMPSLPFLVTPEQIKVALILRDWIEETPDDSIVEKYHIWPADLRNRVETSDWLSHSLYEISRVTGNERNDLRTLNYRLKSGIQEDLIALTFLPNVGRMRARRLKMNGYDIKKLATSSAKDLERLQGFGERISEGIIKAAKRLVERRVATNS